MVQSKESKRNALHELGYKIFLDRYARKDMTRETLTVGDIVIVVVNATTGQREIGTVTSLDLPEVTIKLLDGEVVTRTIEHVDKPLETAPEQMMERVADAIAGAEKSAKLRKEWAKNFQWLLDDFKFVPGGRILAGAGINDELTFYNCYVVNSPRDSREGIMETLTQMTEIMSRGGGVGINISSLRPRHAYVKGVNGRSSGAVSWGALYSFVTGLIEQGGCFGPNDRIATNAGLIPVHELADRIEAGETIYAHTHKGLRRITARFRNGTKPLFEVTTTRGYSVHITEDHKVAVLMDGEVVTMPLKYLVEGDEILLLLGDGIDADYAPLKPVVYERSVMSTTLNEDVTFPDVLNEELAYFLGYMIGDGYVHIGKKVNWQAPKAIKLATADAHPAIRERLIHTVENLFRLTPKLENGAGACMSIAIYSRLLIEWLITNRLLKAKSADVRVPEAIFRSPSSVMGAFIAGYFDADGSDRGRKSGYGIDSISLDMLRDVQQLLVINGIVSRIHTQQRDGNWQNLHRLTVTGAPFKRRFAEFVPAEKVSGRSGKRDMSNTYPIEVWHKLGARTKYRQRIHDGVSSRISFNQLEHIQTRLQSDDQTDSVARLDAVLHILPDGIASIVPVGDSDVYDFEVDDVHLLSGNGIYTSNSRRGALMLILNDWHPDVFDFVNSKRTAGQITNANISVGISDTLMEAIENDGDWDLMFPDTSHPDYNTLWDGNLEKWRDSGHPMIPYRTIKARDLWNAIIESAWSSAEPGIWFRDRYNKMSNSSYYDEGYIICTNPCGEQGLPGNGVCNLGAINLARFYSEETHDVDWEAFRQTVRYATRFLDNVIDVTPYFFKANETQQLSERRVGLGTMGIAELMIRLGVRYGSDESVAFIDKLYEVFTTTAYETSIELAEEKGAFPKFDAEGFLSSGFMQQMPESIQDGVRQRGIRNVTLLTQAPNGTTGTMVNTSTGIEPFFSWKYYRKSRLGLHEEQVPIVCEYLESQTNGAGLPDYFVTAMELTPEEHVKVQAAIQHWCDSSISKTSNVPNHYTVEQVGDLYRYMYASGCKGGTIYRDGSRDEQVLMLKGDERAETEMKDMKAKTERVEHVATPHHVYPRPRQLDGTTVSRQTPFGTGFITMNSDDNGYPFEVFITIGKAGSDLQADAEGLGRMISLGLRTTAPQNRMEMLKLIIDQLRGIGGARSVGFGPGRVLSLPDAVAVALEEHYLKADHPQQLGLPMNGETHEVEPSPTHTVNGSLSGADICPECGTTTLIRAEGCRKCLTCDYSEC